MTIGGESSVWDDSLVIVTTTNAIEGRRIVEYFRPVVVNLVMGTGLFYDFVADLSDVFGGKSATYQNYLSAMYDEATRELEAKAKAVGANSVVGVTFDFDEISGRGKQMFMLNAVGTPVIARSDQELAQIAEVQEREAAEVAFEMEQRQAKIAASSDVLQGLLSDPEVLKAARDVRRLYGLRVAATFLTRRASELGLEEVSFTEEDLPDQF